MRMSARFFGIERCESADFIYKLWEEMGLVIKDSLGDWRLTDLGLKHGGGWSRGNFKAITFDAEHLLPLMDEFYEKHRK